MTISSTASTFKVTGPEPAIARMTLGADFVDFTTLQNGDVQTNGDLAFTGVGFTVFIPDTTAPVVTLSGGYSNGDTINLKVGDTFTPPVATLTDNVDASRVVEPTSNNVNTATAGSYTITWSGYQDDAGNTADSVTLNFNVIPSIQVSTIPTQDVYLDLTNKISNYPSWDRSKDPVDSDYYKVIIDPVWLDGRGLDSFSLNPSDTSGLSTTNVVEDSGEIMFKMSGGNMGIQYLDITLYSSGRVRNSKLFIHIKDK